MHKGYGVVRRNPRRAGQCPLEAKKSTFFVVSFTKKAILTIIFHNLRRAASDDETLKRHEK